MKNQFLRIYAKNKNPPHADTAEINMEKETGKKPMRMNIQTDDTAWELLAGKGGGEGEMEKDICH